MPDTVHPATVFSCRLMLHFKKSSSDNSVNYIPYILVVKFQFQLRNGWVTNVCMIIIHDYLRMGLFTIKLYLTNV